MHVWKKKPPEQFISTWGIKREAKKKQKGERGSEWRNKNLKVRGDCEERKKEKGMKRKKEWMKKLAREWKKELKHG